MLIRKCNAQHMPEELEPAMRFFSGERVIDIMDSLPKYLQGTAGPLHEEQISTG